MLFDALRGNIWLQIYIKGVKMEEEYNRNYNVLTNQISYLANCMADYAGRPHSDTRADELIEIDRQLSTHTRALKTLQDRRRLEIHRLNSTCQ
jgi:hypothetical protein